MCLVSHSSVMMGVLCVCACICKRHARPYSAVNLSLVSSLLHGNRLLCCNADIYLHHVAPDRYIYCIRSSKHCLSANNEGCRSKEVQQ